jgi:hypothetical protein
MSAKYTLDKNDALNLAKNTGIVALAAALAYLSSNLTNLNLGEYGALAVPVITLALNAAVKWLNDSTKGS